MAGIWWFTVAGAAPGVASGPALNPDTTLAWVGARTIGMQQFREAWAQSRPAGTASLPTPVEAQEFLRTLVDQELIRAAATRERWRWSVADSAGYEALGDRLAMSAALDRVLEDVRVAHRDSVREPGALGILARRHVVAQLAPRWDEPLLARAAARFAALPRPTADSSLAAQLRMLGLSPDFAPADTGQVLAVAGGLGPYTVADLLRQWRALAPYYRPRIEEAQDVRDLVSNGLFERWLRHEAQVRDDHDPRVVAALDRERQQIAVRHYLAREIEGAIRLDSTAVPRWYAAHAEAYALPGRWLVTRLVLTDRAAATRIALELRSAAAAESLVARGLRQGVDYREALGAARDSARFAEAARIGLGAVAGPDSTAEGWAVMRVDAWRDPRQPGFDEVRASVESDWYTARAAERLELLLARERRRTRVRLEPAGLGALCSPLAGSR